MPLSGPQDVLNYWFDATTKQKWWKDSQDLDAPIIAQFDAALEAGAAGAYDSWVSDPMGRLALIVLLDQFPRHIHRGQPGAFATDRKALTLCLEGVGFGHHRHMPTQDHINFFLLPLQHAEDAEVQARSVALYAELIEDEKIKQFAGWHKEVIDLFGRFPHRNSILGRTPTPEEVDYLKNGGHRF